MSKFAEIFVNFVSKDYVANWDSQFNDLFMLVNQNGVDQKYRLHVVSFILEVFEIFNDDLVNRDNAIGAMLPNQGASLAVQVKDKIRAKDIGLISSFFMEVVIKSQTFDDKTVTRTFNILAQLIDWNELAYFEGLIGTCFSIL